MRPCNRSRNIYLVLLFCLTSTSVTTQAQDPDEAGKVIALTGGAFKFEGNEVKSGLEMGSKFNIGDGLEVDQNKTNSKLTLEFNCETLDLQCLVEIPTIEIHEGRLQMIFDEDKDEDLESEQLFRICKLSPGNYYVKGESDPNPCGYFVTKHGKIIKKGTEFELDVGVGNARVFVFKGSVDVYSTNSDKYPDPRTVHAGEWVRFREDQEVDPPKRFTMAIDPGSGSTECIYSNCKLVDNVLIPERPVVTPSVLIPPPPNPPGRR